jgi:hypothetical protein
MTKTWASSTETDEVCEMCQSIYSVKILRLPVRDNDQFACKVCGTILRKWNSTNMPSFTLKVRGRSSENQSIEN